VNRRLKKILAKMQRSAALKRNVKSLRFPTLTRPLFDAPILPTRRHDNAMVFQDALLERICTAYIAAEDAAGEDDIWTELTAENAGFIKALTSRDFATLRTYFSQLFSGPLLFGMGHTDLFLTAKSPYDPNYFSFRCRDTILSLAEALAVKTLPSNQQTSFDDYVASTNGDLAPYIEKIEAELGHTITAPPVGQPPVAEVGPYLVSPDSIRHAYVPYRLRQLGFQANACIMEIGGGFGNVARYAFLQGFRDYSIVDIPYVNAIQAAFLAGAIGEENIALYGETPNTAVKILPSTRKQALPEKLELALNMDSLPEINYEESSDYIRLVKARSKFFFSVNQEAEKTHKGKIEQYCVPDLIRKEGGFTRLHRHPYWMEQGYAEELFAIDTAT